MTMLATTAAAPSTTRARPRRGGRTQQGSQGRPRTGGRTQQATQAGGSASTARPRPAPRPRPQPAPKPPPPKPSRRQRAAAAGRQVRQHAGTEQITRTGYQPVILAEFIAAVLLVAATPFADKNKPGGLSPYEGKDVLQLAALTITFLILALVSSTGPKSGRLVAWFGGLILLTVGLYEAASLAKVLDVFGAGDKAKKHEATGTTQAKGTTTAGGRG